MKSRIASSSSSLSGRFRRKKSKQSHDASMDEKTFHMFGMLNEDIVPIILSFLVESPYENGDTIDGRCIMTHVLPLVNKDFHQYTNLLWKQVLYRVLRKEPFLWDPPLYHLIQKAKHLKTNNALDPNTSHNLDMDMDTIDQALAALKEINHHYENNNNLPQSSPPAVSASASQTSTSLSTSSWMDYKALYQHVVQNHILYRSPLFHMPSTLTIGKEVGLHFFEPRYRLLIAEVMAPFPISYQRGEPIVPTLPSTPTHPINGTSNTTTNHDNPTNKSDRFKYKVFPTFLFANHIPLNVGAEACIVQVQQCMIYPDGTADVILMPISHSWVHSLNRRRGSGDLWETTTIRMGKQSTQKYEQQQQRRLI